MKTMYLPLSILLTGFLYIFIIPAEPFSIKLLFKLIPMALIIFYAYKQCPAEKTVTHWLLLIGLFFCSIGDGTLHWFVVGLTAFLIGHLFYIAGFVTKFTFSLIRFSVIIPLVAYGIFFANKMVKNLHQSGQETLILPVIFYITAILLMALCAFMTQNIWVIAGSLLFVLSDSILAWNKFIESVNFAGPFIMITYYGAQFLIAHSLKTIVVKKKDTKQDSEFINRFA